MRGSTLRRSNITREKIAMLQALADFNRTNSYVDSFQTEIKERELDALWQNFKTHAKTAEKSSLAYFMTGFFAGIIITLIFTTLITCLSNYSILNRDSFTVPKKEQKLEKIALEPADTLPAVVEPLTRQETYTVKSGDTLAGIIIRFYGSYSLDKVDAIQKANNMSSPDALSIGQKLIIPLD